VKVICKLEDGCIKLRIPLPLFRGWEGRGRIKGRSTNLFKRWGRYSKEGGKIEGHVIYASLLGT
jgi:hypothetical protein